jgi:hypothetical protein
VLLLGSGASSVIAGEYHPSVGWTTTPLAGFSTRRWACSATRA